MPQEDPYANYGRPFGMFAYRHGLIAPNDDEDLPVRWLGFYAHEAGTVVLVDEAGTELSYTLGEGGWLPLRVVRVKATGTTATLYGWA